MPSNQTTRRAAAKSRSTTGRPAQVGGAPAQDRELRAQGRKTMQRLLDAGRLVFEKQGYHAARVDDIVKAAKTSHGTFYLYFANKEDLFKALAMDAMSEMEALGAGLGSITIDEEGRERLRAWVTRFVDLYHVHGGVIRAWTEWQFADRDLGQRAQASLLAVSGALSRRIAEARDLPDGAEAEGVACLSMLERFNYFQQSHQIRFDHDEVVETLTRAMFEGFFVPDRSDARRRPRPIASRARRARKAG
jgi:AcrR family transcriptional regulator